MRVETRHNVGDRVAWRGFNATGSGVISRVTVRSDRSGTVILYTVALPNGKHVIVTEESVITEK